MSIEIENGHLFGQHAQKSAAPRCRDKHIGRSDRSCTLRVRHGRETANPKATTRVTADTAAPANGG